MSTSSPGATAGGGASDPNSSSRPKQNSDESLSSAATSDDYEVVSATAAAAAATAADPKLDIVVGEGKERDLEENLDDCLKPSSSSSSPDADADTDADAVTALANESAEDQDGTTFHNVWFLGSLPIKRPKDEPAIQEQIVQLNSGQEEQVGRTETKVRDSVLL